MEELVFQLMQALAPQVLAIVTKQFQDTGVLPTPTQLNALIATQRDEAIKRGEDWLATHKDS
jgi:hypothetical protein